MRGQKVPDELLPEHLKLSTNLSGKEVPLELLPDELLKFQQTHIPTTQPQIIQQQPLEPQIEQFSEQPTSFLGKTWQSVGKPTIGGALGGLELTARAIRKGEVPPQGDVDYTKEIMNLAARTALSIPEKVGAGIEYVGETFLKPIMQGKLGQVIAHEVADIGKTAEQYYTEAKKPFPTQGAVFTTPIIEQLEKWQKPFEVPNEAVVPQAIRTVSQSIASRLPLFAAGVLRGGGISGITHALAGGGTIYGLAKIDELMEIGRKLRPDLPEKELRRVANIAGIVEGVSETALDLAAGKFLRLLGVDISAPLKETVKKTIGINLVQIPKQVLKNYPRILATELAEETIQAYNDIKAFEQLGIPTDQTLLGHAPVTAVSSLLFAGLGAGAQKMKANEILKRLSNENVNPDKRMEAVNSVGYLIYSQNPEIGEVWIRQSYEAVLTKRPIDINEPLKNLILAKEQVRQLAIEPSKEASKITPIEPTPQQPPQPKPAPQQPPQAEEVIIPQQPEPMPQQPAYTEEITIPQPEPTLQPPQPISEKEKAIIAGKTATAVTTEGTKINTQYALMDIDSLQTSHDIGLHTNKAYPKELQPRDRGRVASEEQITRILNTLEPELLGENVLASEGAPIVGEDLAVESGNARTIALKRGYAYSHKNIEKYRKWLSENAERFGFTKEHVEGISKPILVRIRKTDVDRVKFTQEANIPSVALMSATEQAKADAKRLSPDVLNRFVPSETGAINTSANTEFIREFVRRIPKTERSRMMDAEGNLSQDGLRRIQNALLYKAYEDADLASQLIEETDINVKNIATAIFFVSPKISLMKDRIKRGEIHDKDISKDIVKATRKLIQLRNEGIPVSEYLSQLGLFGKELTDTSIKLLEIFNKYKNSSKKIREVLSEYIDGVEGLGSPKQEVMFGEVRIPSKTELLESALKRIEGGETLFDVEEKAIDKAKDDLKRLSPKDIENIIKEVERIAAPGTKVEFVEKISISDKELNEALKSWSAGDTSKTITIRGSHRVVRVNGNQFQSIIQLARGELDPKTTPYHEAFHSVQDLLLTDDEKRKLNLAFKDKDGITSRERQAIAFANFAKRRQQFPSFIAKIFEKIKAFLDALGDFLKGKGFEYSKYRDTSKIFEQAYTGKLRERFEREMEAKELALKERERQLKEEIDERFKGVDLEISADKKRKLGIEDDYFAIEFALLPQNKQVNTKKELEELLEKRLTELKQKIDNKNSEFYRTKIDADRQIAVLEQMAQDGGLQGDQIQAYQAYLDGKISKEKLVQKMTNFANNNIERILKEWHNYLYNNQSYSPFFVEIMINRIAKQTATMEKGKIVTTKLTPDTVTKMPLPLNIDAISRLYRRLQEGNLKNKNWVEEYYRDIIHVAEEAKLRQERIKSTGKVDGHWIHFKSKEDSTEEEFQENVASLTALAQNTPWCTKNLAESQLRDGEFWVFVDTNNQARVAILIVNEQISELRGIEGDKNQFVEDILSDTVLNFVRERNIKGGEQFVKEEHLKSELRKLKKQYGGVVPVEEISKVAKKYEYEFDKGFNEIDEYGSVDKLVFGITLRSKVAYGRPDILALMKIVVSVDAKIINEVKHVSQYLNIEDKSDLNFLNLTDVGGRINASNTTNIKFPSLNKTGSLFLDKAKNIELDKLQEADMVYAYAARNVSAQSLKEVGGSLDIRKSEEFNAPLLEFVNGKVYLSEAKNFNLKNLKRAAEFDASNIENYTFENLEFVTILNFDNVKNISLPKLKKVRDGDFIELEDLTIDLEEARDIRVELSKNINFPKLQAVEIFLHDVSNSNWGVESLKELYINKSDNTKMDNLRTVGDFHVQNSKDISIPKVEEVRKLKLTDVKEFYAPNLREIGHLGMHNETLQDASDINLSRFEKANRIFLIRVKNLDLSKLNKVSAITIYDSSDIDISGIETVEEITIRDSKNINLSKLKDVEAGSIENSTIHAPLLYKKKPQEGKIDLEIKPSKKESPFSRALEKVSESVQKKTPKIADIFRLGEGRKKTEDITTFGRTVIIPENFEKIFGKHFPELGSIFTAFQQQYRNVSKDVLHVERLFAKIAAHNEQDIREALSAYKHSSNLNELSPKYEKLTKTQKEIFGRIHVLMRAIWRDNLDTAKQRIIDYINANPTIKNKAKEIEAVKSLNSQLSDHKTIQGMIIMLKETLGRMKYYSPQVRTKNWLVFVTGKDEQGKSNVYFAMDFDTETEAIQYKKRLQESLDKKDTSVLMEWYKEAGIPIDKRFKDAINRGNLTIDHDKLEKRPYEVSEAETHKKAYLLLSDMIAERQPMPEIESQILEEIAYNALKGYLSTGWGKHKIHRENIPGYSLDLKGVLEQLQEYAVSYYKAKHKGAVISEVTKQWNRFLKRKGADFPPNLALSLKGYIDYNLGNPEHMLANKVAHGISIYYLFLSMLSSIANMTQNFFVGNTVLIKHGLKLFNPKTISDIHIKNLTFTEKKALAKLIESGVGEALVLNELIGSSTDINKMLKDFSKDINELKHVNLDVLGRLLNDVISVGMLPFRHAEIYVNRLPYFLHVFRQLHGKHSFNEAVEKAIEITNEAHFETTKYNRPVFARGNIGRPLTALMSYNIHMIKTLKKFMTEAGFKTVEQRRTLAGLAYLLGTLVLFGGLSALPFLGMGQLLWESLLRPLYRWGTGGRDLNADIRYLPNNARDFIEGGILKLLGLSGLSGRIGFGLSEDPMRNIAFWMTLQRFNTAYKLAKSGQGERALAELLPGGFRGVYQAKLAEKYGFTTKEGTPILNEDGLPIHPTDKEKAMLNFGLLSNRLLDLRLNTDIAIKAKQQRKKQLAYIRNKMIQAKTEEEMLSAMKLIDKWNQRLVNLAEKNQDNYAELTRLGLMYISMKDVAESIEGKQEGFVNILGGKKAFYLLKSLEREESQ